jgi:hypothetical protein
LRVALGDFVLSQERVSVLFAPAEYERFEAYCLEHGFKKSTLIVRLVREHLDAQGYGFQQGLRGPNATDLKKR